MEDAILSTYQLRKYFPVSKTIFSDSAGMIKAVDDVDIQVFRGETLGLVGESGCGKSTLGRLILRLEDPTGGEIFFEGENITRLKSKALKAYRKRVQIVFQDPYASLNPRKTAADIIGEPFIIQDHDGQKDIKDAAMSLMEMVGLSPEQGKRYPHEFSGGQRQRIGIARALALKPSVVIADEPVSSLDVSIQAQILNLMKDLQRDFNLTYVFISHDLSVIRFMSDRIAVMYMGKVVETAPNEILYESPRHPYTKALLSAIPVIPTPGTIGMMKHILKEDVPQKPPISGCVFQPRCPYQVEICRKEAPPIKAASTYHKFACHL
ncbi:MAG: Oligopeptide transport ATP-binding protein OppF [Syntrophus sp. SKADARSKE-3]|nr:Oligopeptide transport ATP-binding protein OppF [Syntrophus sp. SKADARSKE-3]